MSRQADIQKLIVNYTRHLQKLKEQEALQGLSVSPAILLQIEDIESKLEALQSFLEQAKNEPEAKSIPLIDLDSELAQLKTEAKPETSQIYLGNVLFSNIENSSIKTGNTSIDIKPGGDLVIGNKTTISHDKDGLVAQDRLMAALNEWKRAVEAKITTLPELEADEKADLKDKAARVAEEAAKGIKANPGKLERLLNAMSAMAPDILEVTAVILKNPFAGVGLVLQKINDKIKLERQTK